MTAACLHLNLAAEGGPSAAAMPPATWSASKLPRLCLRVMAPSRTWRWVAWPGTLTTVRPWSERPPKSSRAAHTSRHRCPHAEDARVVRSAPRRLTPSTT
eukprot:1236379-Pyramimonas_sp.AAC.1